ncbi:MAG: cytochrome c [Woeseia sp.]|nr:cytochrome c [Woeseia sp.]
MFFGLNALADESPGFGEPVSANDLNALDVTVEPDGKGLPNGSGSAVEGAMVYQNHCFACHGKNGEDGINARLAGGHGSLTTAIPVKTLGSFWPYATTIFDYVRRAMPFQTPGTLSNDELYAVTAYLLFINDVIDEEQMMNAESLPAVSMPNRDNFVWDFIPRN